MYKIAGQNSIIHLESGTVFQMPPVESFGLDYQRWLDAGNTPQPAAVLPVLVPSEVTMRQARLALLGVGKLASVDVFINSLPDPPKTAAKIEWEFSNSIQRHNGFVAQIAPQLGMTSAELDNLFITASKL